MENLTLWIGIVSLVVSLITIITVVLIKVNIKNILASGTILYDENYVVKKNALTNALNLADDISTFGKSIINDNTFNRKAKDCYNNLLCVVSDLKIAKTFESIALDTNYATSSLDFANFKLACRKEIGFKVKMLKQKNSETKPKAQKITKHLK